MMKEIYKDSGLGKWFSQGAEGDPGWDRYSTSGERIGKCGDAKKGDAYSACLPADKAKKMGKEKVASYVRRKRKAQSDAGDSEKGGETKKGQKPVYVKTEDFKVTKEYLEKMAGNLRKAGFDLRKPINRKKAWDVVGSMAVSRLADKGYIDIEGGEPRQKRESKESAMGFKEFITEQDNTAQVSKSLKAFLKRKYPKATFVVRSKGGKNRLIMVLIKNNSGDPAVLDNKMRADLMKIEYPNSKPSNPENVTYGNISVNMASLGTDTWSSYLADQGINESSVVEKKVINKDLNLGFLVEKTGSPSEIASSIQKLTRKYGWEIRDPSGGVLSIEKKFKKNDKDAYMQCEAEAEEIMYLLPQTRAGSVWGSTSDGVGGAVALSKGVFVMNKSGGDKAALKMLSKMI